MLEGGCLCGRIRYAAGGTPFHATACHCTDCRRSSGAPFVAWFSVPADQFRLLQGELRGFASSPGVQRGFCGDCGTSLTYRNEAQPEIDVSTATLDEPDRVPAQDHIWTRSKLGWVELGSQLPAYAKGRDDPE